MAAESARHTGCSRRAGRPQAEGRDVVIGYLEPHDRPETRRSPKGSRWCRACARSTAALELEEMDVDAVIARARRSSR